MRNARLLTEQRTHDALLTRLSNDDDIERSLSTFADEMSTSAMILGKASSKTPKSDAQFYLGLSTSQSLILIDELGRGTSPIEGIGISHAIAEKLIEMKVCLNATVLQRAKRPRSHTSFSQRWYLKIISDKFKFQDFFADTSVICLSHYRDIQMSLSTSFPKSSCTQG